MTGKARDLDIRIATGSFLNDRVLTFYAPFAIVMSPLGYSS